MQLAKMKWNIAANDSRSCAQKMATPAYTPKAVRAEQSIGSGCVRLEVRGGFCSRGFGWDKARRGVDGKRSVF